MSWNTVHEELRLTVYDSAMNNEIMASGTAGSSEILQCVGVVTDCCRGAGEPDGCTVLEHGIHRREAVHCRNELFYDLHPSEKFITARERIGGQSGAKMHGDDLRPDSPGRARSVADARESRKLIGRRRRPTVDERVVVGNEIIQVACELLSEVRRVGSRPRRADGTGDRSPWSRGTRRHTRQTMRLRRRHGGAVAASDHRTSTGSAGRVGVSRVGVTERTIVAAVATVGVATVRVRDATSTLRIEATAGVDPPPPQRPTSHDLSDRRDWSDC